MTFEEYQQAAVSFRTDTANNEEYLTLGLIAEVGEAAGKLAKRRRDGVWDEKAFIKELGDILWFIANLADYYDDANIHEVLKDCFAYIKLSTKQDYNNMRYFAKRAVQVAADDDDDYTLYESTVDWLASIAKSFGYTLEQVAEINIAKLRDRQARGVIKGNGDER